MNAAENARILKTSNLSMGYDGRIVLSSVNLELQKGSFVSLLGPNGAGKTTLLRTLARLIRPVLGSVYLNGTELSSFKQDKLARLLSVVLTERTSPGLFSVFEFVALGRYPHTGFLGKLTLRDKKAVMDALNQVNARELVHRQLDTLSDGERQKVLVARALAQEPELILLDEPTLHLDLKHRMEVMGILQRLCRDKGITVVASLHDVDIAAKVSDQVVLVKEGSVLGWGPPEEMLDENKVSALYDFNGARFNPALGSIEIRGSGNRGTIFVIAGMGSGATLYRMLVKKGFSICTGVLHSNDLDYYVASSLEGEYVSVSPMLPVSIGEIEEAQALVEKSHCVIDAGFTLGSLNCLNVRLMISAVEMNKPVFTLRSRSEIEKIVPEIASSVIYCSTKSSLMTGIISWIEQNG